MNNTESGSTNPVATEDAISVHDFSEKILEQDSTPLSTLVLGDASDTTANSLSQRLAKKTKKQVFVSYNLPTTEANLTLLVENRIKKEMEVFPDKF